MTENEIEMTRTAILNLSGNRSPKCFKASVGRQPNGLTGADLRSERNFSAIPYCQCNPLRWGFGRSRPGAGVKI
jgi:hypothetical protein